MKSLTQKTKIRGNNQVSRRFGRYPFHITSVSGHCMLYICKIWQIVAGTSMIRRFHKFLESNFWRVFDFWPHCEHEHMGAKIPLPLWCLDERTRRRLKSEMISFERWKINGKYFFIIWHNILVFFFFLHFNF